MAGARVSRPAPAVEVKPIAATGVNQEQLIAVDADGAVSMCCTAR
jgi:hypothetical protein